MERINEVISKNLIKYRMLSGMTQKELSQRINYSDKAVSKWETGKGLPDISVLVRLSELYGITVNEFLDESALDENTPDMTLDEKTRKRRGIMLLSSVLAVVIASFVFYVLFLIPSTTSKSWLAFIYVIPVVGIIDLVFSCIWFRKTARIIFSSVVIWGAVLALCLTWLRPEPVMFVLVGFFFEALDVIWFIFVEKYFKTKKPFKRLKKSNDKAEEETSD